MRSRIRFWTVVAVFTGLAAAGCGRYTNENTPVKVVTDEEMRQMHETNKKIAEMGLKNVGAPTPKGKAAKK